MAISQCPHRVPPSMWAWISAPPRCRLTGPGGVHHGDHTARHVLPNVGKMAFRWKGMKRRQPPQVSLPAPSASHINPAKGRLV